MAECNDYEGLRINPTPSSIGNQYAGVSTSDKPTGVPTYSIYLELDTGKFYYYDGSEWQELPCACGGEGGGGGSDFSTAQVTVTNNSSSVITLNVPGVGDDPAGTTFYYYIDPGDSMTITAILYQETAVLLIQNNPTAAVSGDIEADGDGYYIVTGDCTITIGQILAN